MGEARQQLGRSGRGGSASALGTRKRDGRTPPLDEPRLRTAQGGSDERAARATRRGHGLSELCLHHLHLPSLVKTNVATYKEYKCAFFTNKLCVPYQVRSQPAWQASHPHGVRTMRLLQRTTFSFVVS